MGVVSINTETNRIRSAFFRALFGQSEGYVCAATIDQDRSYQEAFFKYPENLGNLLEFINRNYHGRNIYFCPQLLKSDRVRTKMNVKVCTCVWADLDECDPKILDPAPSIVIQTSPGRTQAYWLLSSPVEPFEAEDASHRIAYKYAEHGADKSGWDLTQLLRVPLTYNMKYEMPGNIPVVAPVPELTKGTRYSIELFKQIEQVPGHEFIDQPVPDISELDPDQILEKNRNVLDPSAAVLYSQEPTEDWSSSLFHLEMLLFEAGLSQEEVFAVCQSAKCNKFERDGRGEMLWKDVVRAWIRFQERLQLTTGLIVPQPLLDPDERKLLEDWPPTFVDEYVEWARGRGDAAWQYHEAGAITILSHLLSSAVILPTSFGIMRLNVWFMTLADTTLTRKSTAMDMAMDLLLLVDQDAVLATDGSIEGLMTAIASRPNRPGIFWRDEFSGLIEAMRKKDYLAGMVEALTKLYDGKYQKRILRRETVEIRDPILIIYCGGIRSRILEQFDAEHVVSGFAPRFIFVTAESNIDNFRPIGPMTDTQDEKRGELLKKLQDLKGRYTAEMTVKIGEQVVSTPRTFEAQLPSEVWDRYNKFERDMLELGMESSSPEVFTPTLDRLAKSTLKVSVLLAAYGQNPQDGVTVRMGDLLKAISYAERWRDYSIEVVSNVGKTTNERVVERIMATVHRHPGVTKSVIMQNHHLNARDASWHLETLDQRGMIRRVRYGRTERIFPTAVR